MRPDAVSARLSYFDGNNTSLNELLLEADSEVLYEDFCDVSEFANKEWVTRYGC
jgi:hypothetical protein